MKRILAAALAMLFLISFAFAEAPVRQASNPLQRIIEAILQIGGRFLSPQGQEETDAQPCALTFDSFDGGGPEYSVEIGDPSLLACSRGASYRDEDHEFLDGAGYDVTFVFSGLRAGSTLVSVVSSSPLGGDQRYLYRATVDERLHVTLDLLTVEDLDAFVRSVPTLVLEAGGLIFTADLEDSASADAFAEKLSSAALEIGMRDAGPFEKRGALPWTLPACDEKITAAPGDVLLYQGNQIAVCYGECAGEFTRLARIGSVEGEKLLAAFGAENVIVSFWMEWSE